MGEIKSTLEIIMEKTKGLTMSEKEKTAFQREEVEGKARGLLQKYLDGFLSLEGVQREIAAFGDEKRAMAVDILTRECLERMDPEMDGGPLFEILREVAGLDPGPFHVLQTECQRRLGEKKQERENFLLNRLKERGISGSAVIPNMAADPQWQSVLEEMKQAFRDEADKIMN
ncbi:MAG: hypothetical protein V1758_12235 [Pseudomonadota bacterium]